MDDATQSAIGINPNPAMPLPATPIAPQAQPAPQTGIPAMQQNYQTQAKAFEGERGDIQKREQQQLADVPKVEMPSMDFKPMVRDVSAFGALMMVVGALAGRSTMQPMTAALNNMTGVMKGLKEGDKQLYDMHKAEFERNYKMGMDKYNAFIDKRREIIMESKGDMAVVNQKMLDLYREAGIDIHAQQAMDKGMHDIQTLQFNQQKQYDNIQLQLQKLHDQKWGRDDQVGGEKERKVMDAVNKLQLKRDDELSKVHGTDKAAQDKKDEINERINKQIAEARGGGAPAAPAAGGTKSFNTEADAEAAAKAGTLKAGDKITIGGVSGTWK